MNANIVDDVLKVQVDTFYNYVVVAEVSILFEDLLTLYDHDVLH